MSDPRESIGSRRSGPFPFLVILVLGTTGCGGWTDADLAWERRHENFMWKPEQVTVELRESNPNVPRILLRNALRGEVGWVRMEVRLPRRWQVRKAELVNGDVLVEKADGEVRAIRPPGITKLDLVDVEAESEEEIERLWEEHSKVVTRAR